MKKRALVVGINEYDELHHFTALKGAQEDAIAFGSFLERHCGFAVERLLGKDVRPRHISRVVRQVTAGLTKDDLFLFYFAGHGHENERGQLLLCHEADNLNWSDVVSITDLEKQTGFGGLP